MADTTAENMAESTTFDAKAFSGQGTTRDAVRLPEELFDGTVNMPVMHQAVKAFLANRRQGNASTKTRGEVSGGNAKPWKQKGTGRARQGSTRAPHWPGGGVAFGPRPRSYAEYVPRQVRALARKSAFNARAREGAVLIVDQLSFDKPKTHRMLALLARLGVANKKVLVLTDGLKENVYLSARNLTMTHVLPYSDVSTYHILWSDYVIIESSAIGTELDVMKEEDTLDARAVKSRGGEGAAEGDKPAKKSTAAKKKATADASGAKTSAKKPAAKKAASKKGKE